MKPYRLSRRNFIAGIGGATGLAAFLRSSEAAAAGEKAPRRFMVIFHPVGGIYDAWACSGSETSFSLSPILAPFAPVQSNMVVLEETPSVFRSARISG